MIFLQILKSLFIVFILTILTQTGGIIYLMYKPISLYISRKFDRKRKRILPKHLAFIALYSIINIFITPMLARKSGRVPLPIFSNDETPLSAAKWYTVIMNRYYVTPELKSVAIEVSKKMKQHYKGTTLSYLDANFPFIDGFPLLPHLSHDDGEKLDLAFFYKNKSDRWNGNPGWIGYGFCEGPKAAEVNTTKKCLSNGYWQYDILSKLNIGLGNSKYQFDGERTKFMIQAFANHSSIKKLFLEPHLKSRLGLSSGKIRFQGCHSVRHDDHLHVQL